MMPGGLDPISELQRLTVSLRGGFEQKDGCLVFHFTGQLDAYSEKQFMEYVGDVLKANKLPSVLDLSKIDFLDSSGLGALGSAGQAMHGCQTVVCAGGEHQGDADDQVGAS